MNAEGFVDNLTFFRSNLQEVNNFVTTYGTYFKIY